MSRQKSDDPNELKTSAAATPADSTPRPPDPEPPALAPEHELLWKGFLEELKNHEDWESEFTPPPFNPGRSLRAVVEAAGVAGEQTLTEAATSDDSSLRYWARVGINSRRRTRRAFPCGRNSAASTAAGRCASGAG